MDRMNSPLGADQLRFTACLEAVSGVLGHADWIAPLKAYCTGLLLPGACKSIESMAARIAPARVQATHQALLHVVAKGEWSDDAFAGPGPPRGPAADRASGSDPGLDRCMTPAFPRKAATRDLTGWLWTGLIERISQDQRSWR